MSEKDGNSSEYQFGDFIFNPHDRVLRGKGRLGGMVLRRQVSVLLEALLSSPRPLERVELAQTIWGGISVRADYLSGQNLDRVLSDLRKAFRALGNVSVLRLDSGSRYSIAEAVRNRSTASSRGLNPIVTTGELRGIASTTEHGVLHGYSEVYIWCRQPIESAEPGSVLGNMLNGVRYHFFFGGEDLGALSELLCALIAESRHLPVKIPSDKIRSNIKLMESQLRVTVNPDLPLFEYLTILNPQDRAAVAAYLRRPETDECILIGQGRAISDMSTWIERLGHESSAVISVSTLFDSQQAIKRDLQDRISRFFGQASPINDELNRLVVLQGTM